ncbi:MAG: efflux RND transporter periplasmic adaptor subunit [Holophagales bacterium]|jgi:HlyD family secretion protein|nr:efflux RND transporter periplasmic adaptor subunit [Holophagales bacterium]
MKRKVWIIGGSALLALIVVGLLTRKDEGLLVTVSNVGRESLVSKVSANGKIQAVRKADLSANLSGQVTRLTVKEGDRVREGQFLLEIDPARTKAYVESLEAALNGSLADLESTKANLEQARSDFARAESNWKNGIISVQEYENAKTKLTTYQSSLEAATKRIEQSRATLEQAKVDHAKTVIVSPMDGVVTSRRIEQGETAVIGTMNQPGTVLLTISDMSKVETEMEVDEASIPNVKNGLEAQVRIDAYPNQTFKGVVTEVGGSPLLQSGQQAAVKFKVKVQILDPPDTIKPGLSAQADIFTGSSDNALAIPFQALVVRDIQLKEGETFKPGDKKEEEGVFLVDAGAVKFVPIKTGLAGDMSIEVLEGLKEGDVIASGPLRALRELRDGTKVKVDAKKAGPGKAGPGNAGKS